MLDLSTGIAGATVAMHLGDVGADVVRVEAPDGDRWKRYPGSLTWNRGKQVCRMSVDDPALVRLLAAADVVVDDRPQADMAAAGCDPDAARRSNEALIHLWLPAIAGHGPWQALPPDPLLQAAALGALDKSRPAESHTPVVAYQQGLLGATAAAAGLVGRSRTGCPASLTVSGLHALSALHIAQLVRGVSRETIVGALPHYRLYLDCDGLPFAFCAFAPHFFLSALDALDLVELMVTPGLDGAYERLNLPEVGEPIGERLAEHFSTNTREHWVNLLRSVGVPCASVATRAEWMDSEVITGAGMKVEREHPELGTVVMPGVALSFSGASLEPPGFARSADVDELWLDRAVTEEGVVGAPMVPGTAALDGIEVIEIGTFVVGTFGSMLLAGFGADVVKVEHPDGDPYRTMSISFMSVNRGKRSIALDLSDASDREVLRALVARSDLVIENLRLGAADRLGIGAEELLRVNPELVHVDVTAWGDVGPMAGMPAFDMLVSASSGMLDAGAAVALTHDVGTATLTAFGALVGLFARERGGGGQRVSTSMAAHSLLCQLGEVTRCATLPPPTPEVTVEDREGRAWLTTDQGTAPVTRVAELLEEPWVSEEHIWVDVHHPEFGLCKAVGEVVAWEQCPAPGFASWSPALDAHGAEIRAELAADPAT